MSPELDAIVRRSPYLAAIWERERPRRPDEMSTDELLAEYNRLTGATEHLQQELQAVLGPDPEGDQMWHRHHAEIKQVETELLPMRPLVGEAVDDWRGQRRLHLYVLPELDEALRGELQRQAPALAEAAHLVSPVPGERLHLSLGRVLAPDDQVTDEQISALIRGLNTEFEAAGGVAPQMERLMLPVPTQYGVILYSPDQTPYHPDDYPGSLEYLAESGNRVDLRLAEVGVRLTSPVLKTPWHMATAYTHTAGIGRDLARAIRATKVSGGFEAAVVPVQPARLVLAWVDQDAQTPSYSWETVYSWDLTGQA